MISETGFSTDISKLVPLVESIDWTENNRVQLNDPTGDWLYDPYEIKPEWKNTEFARLLNEIPYPVGEARLIRLAPGESYRAHADIDDRLHINILSNEHCFLIDLKAATMYRTPSSGALYYMNAGKVHTASNFGHTDRVQLVIRHRLERSHKPEFKRVSVELTNPPYNARYLVDNSVSPLLNRYCKEGRIGYFDKNSEVLFTLYTDDSVIEDITNLLCETGLSYSIHIDETTYER